MRYKKTAFKNENGFFIGFKKVKLFRNDFKRNFYTHFFM